MDRCIDREVRLCEWSNLPIHLGGKRSLEDPDIALGLHTVNDEPGTTTGTPELTIRRASEW